MIAAIVAPASGIRSRIATSSPSATAYGTPRTSSTTVDGDSRDEADREVAGDVAADRAVDVAPHLRQRGCDVLGQQRVEALDPVRPLEQHEQGQERDRERGDDGIDDALRHRQRGAREAEHAGRTALLDRLPDLLDDLVVALEEAEPAATLVRSST